MPQANSNDSRPLRVLISAGEASGEMYGAALLESLRTLAAESGWEGVECFGMGGEQMRAAGCQTVVNANDVAVVGLAEVVSHLPHIYRKFHKLLAEADRRKPDVAVLIDFPDWNLRLAKQLHRRGIPVVYYVSPQLWAWRKGRVRQVQKYVSKMLVIFPFEQQFYADHRVSAEFVGHPLGEMQPPSITRDEFATKYGLDRQKEWIALLPGSRRKELLMNLEAIMVAARRLGDRYEYLLPVASTLDRGWVSGLVQPLAGNLVTLTDSARESLLHARAGVVASGTATVETALIGTPFVMVYRVSPATYAFGRRLVKLPYYGMVNLIAGRQVVPELIQQDFTADNVLGELEPLISNGARREQMLRDLAEVRARLRGSDQTATAEKAARAVLSVAGAGVVSSTTTH